jgi:hypothetical protein
MTAPGALEVAVLAARHLERLGIPYVIVGSVASAFHGEPRRRRRSSLATPTRSSRQSSWEHLPEHLRATIRTLVDAARSGWGASR